MELYQNIFHFTYEKFKDELQRAEYSSMIFRRYVCLSKELQKEEETDLVLNGNTDVDKYTTDAFIQRKDSDENARKEQLIANFVMVLVLSGT